MQKLRTSSPEGLGSHSTYDLAGVLLETIPCVPELSIQLPLSQNVASLNPIVPPVTYLNGH